MTVSVRKWAGRTSTDQNAIEHAAPPVSGAIESLPTELCQLLDDQNKPESRQAIRRAFELSPDKFGRAAVALAAKKR